jgi:RNA polymerase sigma factor (sigma-70 family)
MSESADSPLPQPPLVGLVETLQRDLRPRMIANLKSRGATEAMAEDVASEILSECLADAESNLLRRFRGTDGLDHWLLRVAINRLISLQRRERVFTPLDGALETRPAESASSALESPLGDLVSRALREAIASLPAGMRVLLWLRYAYGIPQNRLCVCWQCHPSKLSRLLTAAREEVRDRTLDAIRRAEPGLLLQWDDIAEVCADPEIFFS